MPLALPDPATPAAEARLAELFAAKGIARGFLADRLMRWATIDGRDGVLLAVRLTSYRSLPLSCIEDVQIAFDGEPVARDAVRLVLGGVEYRLDEVGGLVDRWWFILDMAELFVGVTLPEGVHDVEATLVTVEPYMTAGRFSMFNPDRRRLRLGARFA